MSDDIKVKTDVKLATWGKDVKAGKQYGWEESCWAKKKMWKQGNDVKARKQYGCEEGWQEEKRCREEKICQSEKMLLPWEKYPEIRKIYQKIRKNVKTRIRCQCEPNACALHKRGEGLRGGSPPSPLLPKLQGSGRPSVVPPWLIEIFSLNSSYWKYKDEVQVGDCCLYIPKVPHL